MRSFESKINQAIKATFKISSSIPSHLLDQNNIKKLSHQVIDLLSTKLGLSYTSPQETGFKAWSPTESSISYSLGGKNKAEMFIQVLEDEQQIQVAGELTASIPFKIEHEPADYEDGHLRYLENTDIMLDENGVYESYINVDFDEGYITDINTSFEDIVKNSVETLYNKVESDIQINKDRILKNIQDSQY